ncbi:MAG: hypothetical protein KA244_00930 [Deltaproteobacteria bacterium]|nr:hypothetical protein [Deltaproteobacteria bacterium]
MRQFASSGFRIWNLSREAKVIYSFFCVLSLLALLSSLALYEDLVGPSLQPQRLSRVTAYYSDAQPDIDNPVNKAAQPPSQAPTGGPEIALPEDEQQPPQLTAHRPEKLTVTMPYRKLLEVTHFHLFTVPVFLLILTHLFMLTELSSRHKLLWITVGWVAGSLHIFAPWLIRLGGSRLAFTFPLSGALLLVAGLVLTLYPMLVMWHRPQRHRRPPPHGKGSNADDSRAKLEPEQE